MKITVFSEDTPAGQGVDWPVVPREGEAVQYHHRGGASTLVVDEVLYEVDTDGAFKGVRLRLLYP